MISWRQSLIGSLFVCFGACSGAGGKEKLTPASSVDLDRYMGAWRIIATTDNKAEKDFVDAVETYRLLPGSKIGVDFKWRDKSFDSPVKDHQFKGRVADTRTNAEWKMRLLPLFTASYIILEVDKDYQWAVVGHPSRKFGWVLARQRTIPEATYVHALHTLKKQGYDPGIFRKVPQVRASTVDPRGH